MTNFTQFRCARPCNSIAKIKEFYVDGLGLPIIGEFSEHAGISGIMLGLPDAKYHLEFTQHHEPMNLAPPSKDNLLVFYYENKTLRDEVVNRLTDLNYDIVEPENPYWMTHGVTIEDPDNWRIVLMEVPKFDVESE